MDAKGGNYIMRTLSISVSGQLITGQKATLPFKIVYDNSKMHNSVQSREHHEFQPENSE